MTARQQSSEIAVSRRTLISVSAIAALLTTVVLVSVAFLNSPFPQRALQLVLAAISFSGAVYFHAVSPARSSDESRTVAAVYGLLALYFAGRAGQFYYYGEVGQLVEIIALVTAGAIIIVGGVLMAAEIGDVDRAFEYVNQRFRD